ncbi:HEAT repeat domain-containing protein [Corallococcus sp. M34]|uniref:HEAT repeat domain-containing protein n=1 Tax=Citreicoccus inhibens TaxID=2849499 RepID=UPI001C24381B|nr:HEAT repeat domain-containing protein [Citreicoccus inhibens]MBU8897497.1 HEAT repeat domain-containing protein [Citreicoccus inhibens]
MPRLLGCILSLLMLSGCVSHREQTPPPSPIEAPPPLSPTTYRFDGIEVFGSRRHPKADLLAPYLAGVPAEGTLLDMASKDGDAFIQTLARGKEHLLAQYGFAMVRNSVTAYQKDRTLRVTVDVVDPEDAWRLQYDPAPTGSVAEPAGLLAAWTAYTTRMWQLVNAGTISSDVTEPCRAFHCFYGPGHPELMKLEEPFLAGVPQHFTALVQMLHTDADPTRREAAAFLLAYGITRESVVDALVPAMSDPHEAPRNAAMRVLWELQEKADRPLVPLEKVLRGLQGPLITDRNKAAGLLSALVHKDASARERILRETGDLLLEMAGSKQQVERKPALDVLRTLSRQDFGDEVSAWRAWVESALRTGKESPPASTPRAQSR